MHRDVHVVVVGVGTCGEDLALRLLGEGLDVVGVESALIGGECAYWACLPSKLMIRAANLLQEARRVNGTAGRAEVAPDWSLLAKRVRQEVTGGWDDAVAVARFEGRAARWSADTDSSRVPGPWRWPATLARPGHAAAASEQRGCADRVATEVVGRPAQAAALGRQGLLEWAAVHVDHPVASLDGLARQADDPRDELVLTGRGDAEPGRERVPTAAAAGPPLAPSRGRWIR